MGTVGRIAGTYNSRPYILNRIFPSQLNDSPSFFLLLLESGGIKTQLLDHLKFAKVLTGQLSRTMAESIRNPNFFQYPGFSYYNRAAIKNIFTYNIYIYVGGGGGANFSFLDFKPLLKS